MKVAADKDLYSLGRLSQQYQEHPRTIEAALDSIGAEPELSLNGLRYFAVSAELDAQLRGLLATLRSDRADNDRLNAGAKWVASLPIRENYKPVFPKAVPADTSVDGGSAGVDAN